MTRRPAGRRAGFSLIEMTVVLWALGVIMVLGAELIVAGMRAGRVGETADTRATYRGELARVFRADAARAEAAPEKQGEVEADPARLFLRLAGGTTVTYEFADGALVRTERTGDKEVRRALPLGPGTVRVEFPRPASGVAVLRLVETPKAGPARTSEIAAALGGDLR